MNRPKLPYPIFTLTPRLCRVAGCYASREGLIYRTEDSTLRREPPVSSTGRGWPSQDLLNPQDVVDMVEPPVDGFMDSPSIDIQNVTSADSICRRIPWRWYMHVPHRSTSKTRTTNHIRRDAAACYTGTGAGTGIHTGTGYSVGSVDSICAYGSPHPACGNPGY